MKLRTTVFAWVLALVVVVVGVTIGVAAVAFDRSTRTRLAEDMSHARHVVIDLEANLHSLHEQECRVMAEEPRLKAVVATTDIARSTIADEVHDLGGTLHAGVFVLVDADGRLIADSADPKAEGFDMTNLPVVAKALKQGAAPGAWLADHKAYQVQGCRMQFGTETVGALVIGHAIDDEFAATVERQTGDQLVLVDNGAPLTAVPAGMTTAQITAGVAAVAGGAKEVQLGDTHYFAQLVPVVAYEGDHTVSYLLVRSIDEALAPGRRMLHLLLGLLGGAVLAALVIAMLLARRVSKPIYALVARTQDIVKGDLEAKPVSGPTEIETLGRAMDTMASELDVSRKALAEQERLAQEMEIAAKIQTSILPRVLTVANLDIAAKMLTATEVGGDYYDVLPVDDGCWIAIGDASGHGLTAGLVMMMVQTGVATLVRANPHTHPRALVSTLNDVIYSNIHDRLEAERHMTLSVLRYTQSGQIVVAGAHMDAVVWRAATQTVELLGTPGTFLAITQDIEHVNLEVTWQLHDQDVLILLTDGVTEAEDRAGVPFGYERVTAALTAHATEPVAAIRDALLKALAGHAPTLADDATILALRYVIRGETRT